MNNYIENYCYNFNIIRLQRRYGKAPKELRGPRYEGLYGMLRRRENSACKIF